jgi:Tfp pilus assembly protein PilN
VAPDPRATKAAAGVARDLQVPWAEMLTALENVQAKDVALLGVEPSATRHNIRITAETKSLDAMLNYVDALRSDSFPEVSLASHQVEPQTPGNPVRFVVQARWRSQ